MNEIKTRVSSNWFLWCRQHLQRHRILVNHPSRCRVTHDTVTRWCHECHESCQVGPMGYLAAPQTQEGRGASVTRLSQDCHKNHSWPCLVCDDDKVLTGDNQVFSRLPRVKRPDNQRLMRFVSIKREPRRICENWIRNDEECFRQLSWFVTNTRTLKWFLWCQGMSKSWSQTHQIGTMSLFTFMQKYATHKIFVWTHVWSVLEVGQKIGKNENIQI